MSYRVTATDPAWQADDFTGALERGVAEFAKTQGIATQAAYDAFITGLTSTQSIAVVRKILATVKCIP